MTDKPKSEKTFTVAALARSLKIDEKVARRRMRANAAREKSSPVPKELADAGRKNARYTYNNTEGNVKQVTAIITAQTAG